MKRRTKCVHNPPTQYDHQVCPQQSSLDHVYPCYTQKQSISPQPPPLKLSTHPVLSIEYGCGEVPRISAHVSDIRKIRKTEIGHGKQNITRLEQIINEDGDKLVISRSVEAKLKPSEKELT